MSGLNSGALLGLKEITMENEYFRVSISNDIDDERRYDRKVFGPGTSREDVASFICDVADSYNWTPATFRNVLDAFFPRFSDGERSFTGTSEIDGQCVIIGVRQ